MALFRLPDGDALVDLDGISAETGYSRKTIEAFIARRRRTDARPFPAAQVEWGSSGRPVGCWLLSEASAWLDETAPRVGPRPRRDVS